MTDLLECRQCNVQTMSDDHHEQQHQTTHTYHAQCHYQDVIHSTDSYYLPRLYSRLIMEILYGTKKRPSRVQL